jgi:hypothetical protein
LNPHDRDRPVRNEFHDVSRNGGTAVTGSVDVFATHNNNPTAQERTLAILARQEFGAALHDDVEEV